MFKLRYNLGGTCSAPIIVKMPTGALSAETTFKEGAALCYSSGKLALCTGSSKAEWICANTRKIGTSGGYLDVYRVTPDLVFEVECDDYDASVTCLGAAVQFGSGSNAGMTITDAAVLDVTGGDTYSKTGLVQGFGAKIIDTLGTTEDNGKMLVVLR